MKSFFSFLTPRIYADAAASMPPSRRSLLKFEELSRLYGNPGGLHAEAVRAKEALEGARAEVARSIGAHADEIVFTSGGTEGNNLAIEGVLRPLLGAGERAHAVTLRIEHPSVLEPLIALEEEGLEATYLPVGPEGVASAKEVGETIEANTALVSVQAVNSEIGTLQPVREIAKEVRRVRTLRPFNRIQGRPEEFEGQQAQGGLPLYFHTDASQAPPWLPLNVEKLGVDLLTLDGQKFGAPRGVGALYVRRKTALAPRILGGGQERGIRSGTENVALAGAFAVALTEAQEGAEKRSKRIADVRDYLLEEIRKVLPATVNGSLERRVANNLNVSLPSLEGQMAVVALNERGVATSTRSACSEGDEGPSYVVESLGPAKGFKKKERAQNAIRFTLLPTATYTQMDRIVRALFDVAILHHQ